MGKHRFVIDGQDFEVDVLERGAQSADVSVNGVRYRVDLPPTAPPSGHRAVAPSYPKASSRRPSLTSELRAPMAGRVVGFRVEVGQRVRAGEALVVLDAMKMENTLSAPSEGRVEALEVSVGDTVLQGALLLRLAPA